MNPGNQMKTVGPLAGDVSNMLNRTSIEINGRTFGYGDPESDKE